jgi:hypothetical protein
LHYPSPGAGAGAGAVLQLPDFYYNVMIMTGKVARYLMEGGDFTHWTQIVALNLRVKHTEHR